MLEQYLQQLGLTPTEIQVYLAIVRLGRTTHAPLAKATGINRTTVYSAVKQLLARGIITEDLGVRPAFLVALPATDLQELLTQEERALEAKKQLIDTATKELATLAQQAAYSVPKIVFIEKQRLEAYLYKQAPTWTASVRAQDPDKTWWGFQDISLVEHDAYNAWIDWYWRESAPKDVSLNLLSNESKIEETMAKRAYAQRHIRFWDKSSQFTATTWITGDYLIMINSKQHPHYLIEIHDRLLAHNMRELFKGIWNSSS